MQIEIARRAFEDGRCEVNLVGECCMSESQLRYYRSNQTHTDDGNDYTAGAAGTACETDTSK